MRKRNLEVYRAAVTLAGSGTVSGWKNIEDALLKQGYRRAPQLLDSQKIRAVLDFCCEVSREPKAAAGK
jgi:hypothetical protein